MSDTPHSERHQAKPSVAWLERSLDGPALVGACLLTLIVAGVVLRIQHLPDPETFTFDEELFVKNAHNYLLGMPDANDHPPLGKLLMAAGMLAFGYNSLGFRCVSLCFGIQNLFVAYFLARCLFRSSRAGWFAAAFLAADGFFIAYSRVALLDGVLTCLVLLSVLAAVTARSSRGVALSAVLAGLAASVKWSGAFAVFPAMTAIFVLRQAPRRALLLFALVPLVHVSLWMLALRITDKPHDLVALFQTMRELFAHHVELGHRHHDLASPWYGWLIDYHPIVVKWWLHGRNHHYASSAGNPILWYTATLLSFAVPLLVGLRFILRFVSRLGARLSAKLPSIASLRAELLCSLGWFALLAPWIVGRGTYTFSYHYLPSYAFALILVAGVAARLERLHPRGIQRFAALTLVAFVYFAPVWGEFSISEPAANRRLLFATWRP